MGVYGTDNANWYGGSISQHCIENTIRVVINGGEINTKEEAKEFQGDASYTLYVIREGGFSSHELAKSKKHFKMNDLVKEIEQFRVQKWLKTLDEESFLSAKEENNLKIVQKYCKQMEQKELDLVLGKIDFPTFLIILGAFERQREKLSPSFGKYWPRYNSEQIFKENGFFNEENNFLIDFKKLPEPYIPPKELLDGDFRDLEVEGKIIWGIGPKAITLVDEVKYNEEYAHPRYPVGRKVYINYRKNPERAKKIAEEILNKYGE